MNKLADNRIQMPPIEKAELFVPIAFWSEVLVHLDSKIETICKHYGFGKVEMTIKIHKDKIMEVSFSDEIRIRGLVEKAGSHGDSNSPQQQPYIAEK